MTLRRLFIFAALMCGCAQGTPVDIEPDSTAFPNSDMGTTTAPRDMNTTTVQPPVDMAMTNPGVCTVNEVTCVDAATIGRCRPDQSGYDPTPCSDDTVCMGGACVTAPVCTPGEVDCLDASTVLRCRATGEGYIQMTCDAPLQCAEGMCSDKLPRGAGCSIDGDCASMNCRCGASTDDNCPASLGGGICANTSCVPGGCGPSGYCLAADVIPTGGADYDHCVQACDAGMTCPAGSKCASVPIRTATGHEFHDACYFTGVKSFGDDCSADTECLTGACLQNYFDTGFCSRRCDNDGTCSDGAACVELVPGQFWCTLTCGDGSVVGTEPCPLDVPNDRFDVTCKSLALQGGGVMRVCASP